MKFQDIGFVKQFIFAHAALFSIVVFDLIIGLIVWSYYRSVVPQRREREVAIWVPIIVALVNLSGLFCGATVVGVVATLGGLSLAVWLWSAMDTPEAES